MQEIHFQLTWFPERSQARAQQGRPYEEPKQDASGMGEQGAVFYYKLVVLLIFYNKYMYYFD